MDIDLTTLSVDISFGLPGPAGPAGADGPALHVKNEGTTLTDAATSLDFVGAGVEATQTGDAVTVTISGGGSGGGGDASTNTSTSVDGEGAVFSGTGGKTLKRATGSGIAKLTLGVLGTGTAGTDYSVGTSALATGILKTTTTSGALSIAVAGDFPTLNQNTTGSAASCTGNAATVTTNANLTGEVTSVGNASTVTNSAVIGKVLTGYTSGAGTVAATDTILQAIQKLNGNDATNANLTGDVTSSGNATTIATNAVTLAKMAQIATASVLGRSTAGTGNPEVLSAAATAALLPAMVGDSGSGGTKGLVPAPASGDAAAGKYLKADGTWSTAITMAITVKDEGTTLTSALTSLDFVGGGVVASNTGGAVTVTIAGGGGGDASTNTSISVDSEVALFSGTGGKTVKRATGSGMAKITSGVLSTGTAGTDYSAGTSALSTGLLKSTTTTGALSIATSGTDYSAGTSALATGILKSTTTTGALSIAVAGDFPTLNQNTTGSSASCTGNSATVTTNANLTGEVTSVGNATTVTNSAVIGKVLTGYTSGAGTVAATDTILQAIQKLNGNDATNANLTGEVTSVGNATTVTNAAVIGKVLTGYSSGAGTVAATDTLLQAIQKLNGNDATFVPATSGTLTTPTFAAGIITLTEGAYLELPIGSADGKFTGITTPGTAGSALAFGDVIQKDQSSSKWRLADVSAAAGAVGDARGLIGMCVLAAAGDGSATRILLQGRIRADANFPTLTVGGAVYASTTGDVVVTPPSTTDYVRRVLGFACTADEVYFNPSCDYITST